MYNPETGLLHPKTADDLDLPEAWRQRYVDQKTEDYLPEGWWQSYVDQKTIDQQRGGVKTEDDLPEDSKCSSVDVAQQEPTGNASRKRKPAWETDVAETDPESKDLESMSRLFSWALKYGAFNKYGLIHLEGGWFEVGELLSQDQFEKYSIKDVKWLVAHSCHEKRGPRFQLREDTVEYRKAYFIKSTSDKNTFL